MDTGKDNSRTSRYNPFDGLGSAGRGRGGLERLAAERKQTHVIIK
jgi:hypothetical protein